MTIDLYYMQSALNIAQTGWGRTWPNPTVGCVLIKDGVIIGRARTSDGGRPHAEANALAQAGEQAKGATAYVTLEPCAHEGKTPSCAQSLIKAGVSKVVMAVLDPDTRTNGQGMQFLNQAGIEVVTGVLEKDAFDLNEGFFLQQLRERPLVTLKTATTLDGKTATSTGQSKWITGDIARARGHMLRAQHDAIAVGIGTILADNPCLMSDINGLSHQPIRIVFDTNGKLTGTEKIFETTDQSPVWIISSLDKPNFKQAANTHFISVKKDSDGHCDIKHALKQISQQGITRLMVEGGAHLMSAFIRHNIFDYLYWFRAPQIIGGDGHDAVQPLGIAAIHDQIHLTHQTHQVLGKDTLDIYKAVR